MTVIGSTELRWGGALVTLPGSQHRLQAVVPELGSRSTSVSITRRRGLNQIDISSLPVWIHPEIHKGTGRAVEYPNLSVTVNHFWQTDMLTTRLPYGER